MDRTSVNNKSTDVEAYNRLKVDLVRAFGEDFGHCFSDDDDDDFSTDTESIVVVEANDEWTELKTKRRNNRKMMKPFILGRLFGRVVRIPLRRWK